MGRRRCLATARRGRPIFRSQAYPSPFPSRVTTGWHSQLCRQPSCSRSAQRLGDSARCATETDRATVPRRGKVLDLLNEGRLKAFSIAVLEAPHLYVQEDRSVHAGLSPELAPILTMPARTPARARGAFRPVCRACSVDRQQRVCDIEADDSLADGAKGLGQTGNDDHRTPQ
jgi:hypothetical protein